MRGEALYRYSLNRERVDGVAEDIRTASPLEVVRFLRAVRLHEEEQECLVTIVLGTRSHVRGYHLVTRGLVDKVLGHAREVFRYAIINNASGIVLAHNHPSGNPAPSIKDLEFTREMAAAGGVVGIRLMDHVIVGGDDFYSFADEEML